MADTILSGDITVNYLDDNRQKRLSWTGAATGTRSMNEVYSAMATLLDEAATGDDATCMKADTPVEYTVGLIDANDADPWYMGYELLQHLTGGSLKTSGWTHVDGTDVGIIVVPVGTGGAIVAGDYGLNISGATTGNGTLLEKLTPDGVTDYLVIRPETNAASDTFTTSSQNITCNAHIDVQTAGGVSNTGEQIFANLYNVTPIDADTHVYMYQGLVSDATRARIADVNDNTLDWWEEGAFDRCYYTNDYTTAAFDVIDGGNITVFARKGATLYDNFEVGTSLISGGRNPVPLSASADANNATGYKAFTMGGDSGNFSVGDEVQGDVSGARGIITLITGTSPTQTLHYYLIGDPQTDFNGTEAITNNDDTGTATSSGAVSAQGPALATWFTNNAFPSITHANTTVDIDDTGGAEGYGITFNLNSNPLTEAYEWEKYITRNGGITTTNTDGIEGEQYVGCSVFLEYSGVVTGTVSEGSDVTQAGTGATGIVVSHDTTLKQILLRDTRGTFDTAGLVTDNDVGGTFTPNTTADAFNPVKSAPFGTLAGGRMFFARGVVPSNWVSADENSFQTIDSQGNTKTRPIAITLSVSNLIGTDETTTTDDRVSMHRLTGLAGDIDKTEYSAAGGETTGGNSLVVDTGITADTAGKTAGAWLNIRDASDNNQHYIIRFASWATSTFTFAEFASFVSTATTNTTQITYATGGFDGAVKRGDLVWNSTRSLHSYVTSVDSDTQLTISPAITGQVSTDNIAINVLPVAVNAADDVYVSMIDGYANATSASVSIVYVSPLYFRAKVSNTRNATKLQRFVADDVTSGTDRNVATVRNTDTIHS